MTNQSTDHHSQGLQALKTVLYVLAGIVLLMGLVGSISLMTGALHMAANLLLPVQLVGNQAISKPVFVLHTRGI